MHLGCSICAMCRIMQLFGYDQMIVGDIGYCSGNVMNGHGLYLRDGLLVYMMKT